MSRFKVDTKVSSSEFDKGKTYVGPSIQKSHMLSSETLRLIQNIDSDNGSVITALSADFMYTGGSWAFFESASFEGGDIKKIDKNNRKVLSCASGCTYLEETILELPHGFLEKYRNTGFSVRFNSRNRSGIVVNIPSEYIQGFLSVVPGG